MAFLNTLNDLSKRQVLSDALHCFTPFPSYKNVNYQVRLKASKFRPMLWSRNH